jgi:CheY-like chemotaxis protein
VLAARLWRVEIDPGQMENALLNLAVNARDAMPDGGKLTIETRNTYLDEAYAKAFTEVRPDQYVEVAVSDTGCGMPPEVADRVFEPFFTTKPIGQGTGLGLSQVYGFVKQSSGHVRVYSEVGRGTTIKIYLPRFHGEDAPEDAPDRQAALAGSAGETILVVEDEALVRAFSCEVLRELGYRVLEAGDAETALRLLAPEERVDLLFTDVVLPGGRTGRELADEAVRRVPGIKVLYTTGYARNAIVHHGRLDPGVRLLTKPFAFEDLATQVRDALDRSA